MSIASEVATTAIFYLALIFLAGYVIGRIINYNLAKKIMKSTSELLMDLNIENKGRIIGGKVVPIWGPRLTNNIGPYELVIMLYGYENFLTLPAARLAGRRDMVILRADISKGRPIGRIDVIYNKSPSYKRAISRGGWTLSQDSSYVFRFENISTPIEDKLRAILASISKSGILWSLSIRPGSPNLFVSFPPSTLRGDIQLLLNQLSEVCDLLTRRPG